MSESDADKRSQNKSGDFKIDIDPNLAKSLQGGMDVLQQVFSGIVKAAQDAIGPETLRNLSAGQWLENVATCLEQVGATLRDGGAAPADKTGELACYLELLEEELKGSKVASQTASLRRRLESAMQSIAPNNSNAADQTAGGGRHVEEAAGFFRAAAKSVMPINTGNK